MTDQALDWGDAPKLEKIDMAAFKGLCETAWEARAEVDLLEAQLKEKQKRFGDLLAKVQSVMEATGLDKFHVAGYGLIYSVNRFTVTMPKDAASKELFFDYLKSQGAYEGMITVNYQTLNGWYKKELEAALENGVSDFKVPGITEAKYVKTLSMKKA